MILFGTKGQGERESKTTDVSQPTVCCTTRTRSAGSPVGTSCLDMIIASIRLVSRNPVGLVLLAARFLLELLHFAGQLCHPLIQP